MADNQEMETPASLEEPVPEPDKEGAPVETSEEIVGQPKEEDKPTAQSEAPGDSEAVSTEQEEVKPNAEQEPGDEIKEETAVVDTDAAEAAPESVEGQGEPAGDGVDKPQTPATTEGQAEEDAPQEAKQDEQTEGDATEKEGSKKEVSDEPEEKVAVAEEEGEQTAEEGEAVPEATPAQDQEPSHDTLGVIGEEQEDSSKASPVPQSDTFTEGERPESPGVGVGEKLSREPTPLAEEEHTLQTDSLVPGTPERLGTPEPADEHHHQLTLYEDLPEEKPEFNREQLVEKYHAALAEREQLQNQNYQLQHKLAEYFRKKKADERQDYDKNVTDQEQRYLKYMAQLEDLRRQDQHERENSEYMIEELKDRCEDKKTRVDEERDKFMEFRQQVALNAVNSRSGKQIPPKDIEQYLANANKKEGEVVLVRLENIKLKNKLKKKEQQLKSKEELAEGLHLIDFEQLKIENQTYNEKIEERNEELLKLRKKITSTVQVLTHLKEKLQFVYAENHDQKGNLKEVESHVAQKRDILSRTKKARDSLRIDNQRLRQNCGLLGSEPLLRDFEERKDESDELKHQLENLKMQHAELTLNCNQVRRKIEQARGGRP